MYLLRLIFLKKVETRIDTRFDFAPDWGTKQAIQ
jgi:hypothetical protein